MLFVDDEPMAARPLIRALSQAGARVDFVDNGTDAIARLQSTDFRVMVLDLSLPDISGETVLAIVRSRNHSIRVIVLTGWGPSDDPAGEALRLGADHYLCKPLRGSLLVRVVDDVLTSRFVRIADPMVWPHTGPDPAGFRNATSLRTESVLGFLATWPFEPKSRTISRDPSVLRDRFETHLLRLLVTREISVPLFWTTTYALRQIQSLSPDDLARQLPDLRRRFARASRFSIELLNDVERRTVETLSQAPVDIRLRERDIAAGVDVDPAHLGRRLHQATGLGFRQWVWGRALKVAVIALSEGALSIKQVAHASGFVTSKGSTAGFERSFRRAFGCLPTDFRRRVQALDLSD